MVVERRTSTSESLAYLALVLSVLGPNIQEQFNFDQATINSLTNRLSPYNLTGQAFSGPYGSKNKVENLSSNEAFASGVSYDPLKQYLRWQSGARFDADAVALIFGDSAPRPQLEALDSESGYSSDEAKSPFSTSNYHQPDLSDLGAAGYTPPADLDALLNSFEDYIDIDSFQTNEPNKGAFDIQENLFDFSGYEVKQEPSFYPNKLDPNENFYYKSEYKTAPDGSTFQDSLEKELENNIFDPFTIDFSNTLTNSSFDFGEDDLDKHLDLDSLGSLDFGLPLDILNPAGETDQQLESQLFLQDPATTRDSNVHTTSEENDIDVKHEIPLSLPSSNVKRLSIFKSDEQQKTKEVHSTSKKVTEMKYKPLKTEDFLFGVSEQKITEMPVSEFNIFVEKLSEEEAKFVREVRRRGKNKEAARMCRKRKIEAIESLDDELEMLKNEKTKILEERRAVLEETKSLKSRIKDLENSIISSLKDDNGRPLSSREYSIFQGPNGAVYVGKTITDKEKIQDTR